MLVEGAPVPALEALRRVDVRLDVPQSGGLLGDFLGLAFLE